MSGQTVYSRNFLLHLQDRPGFDTPILLKEPAAEFPSRSLCDQLHNEHAITLKLAGIAGVRPIHVLEGSVRHPVLIMEFIEGLSLDELIRSGSLHLAEKLRLAVNVASVLRRIHERQVMHCDLNSSNILVTTGNGSESEGDAYVIDFGMASLIRQDSTPYPTTDDFPVGNLAFISPEQTGRMNRSVDYRTDIYSLGIVLYQLFTGQLPFQSNDALGLIHDHIARKPRPLHEVEPSVPSALSEIVLRLLAKNPEDRYQTLQGLQADLKRCLDQWQKEGRIDSFELGADDYIGCLRIPEKLYGRQAEIERLQSIMDQAFTTQAQLLLVAGYSGVGKTSLVHELHKDVLANQGTYIEGKFDQLKRTNPYSAWEQAFTQLVDNWLAQDDDSLAHWRDTILNAVGINGQVLLDVIPDLERVLGSQPDVPELGGIERQKRVNHYFSRFISYLATPENPLVIFLDDLQWIDLASLNLIEALFLSPSASRLMVIGAYRSNEVNAAHPLAVSQEQMRAQGDWVTTLNLQDLTLDDTNNLLADSLQTNIVECEDLGGLLGEKSAGNPFFYKQLLYAVVDDGLLRFDDNQDRWKWGQDLIKNVQARGSVVNLMAGKVRILPDNTQRALSMAACIGNRFDIPTLRTILEQSHEEILASLNPAIQSNLLLLLGKDLTFAHDRIQEAAYSLIPEADRPGIHLKLGRALFVMTEKKGLEEEIFTIIGHLNFGWTSIESDSERLELAAMNLTAGRKAKAASAYADAKAYIEIGLGLLPTNPWQDHYDMTLSLHTENTELAYLTGRFDEVMISAALVHTNARRNLDRAPVYMTQIEAATSRSQFAEGLDLGLSALKDLGVNIPDHPTQQYGQHLHERFVDLLTNEPLKRLDQLPKMTDEKARAASALLASVMSTAYIANPPLFPIISYQGAMLTFEFGIDSWSPFFVGGIVLVNVASINPDTPIQEAEDVILFGRQLVDVIQALVDNPITARSRTKGLFMLAFTAPWFYECETALEFSRSTYQSRIETGDWLYGAYGASLFTSQGLAAGINLSHFQRQLETYKDTLQSVGQVMNPTSMAIYMQAAENLVTQYPAPNRLSGKHFDEDEWISQPSAATDIANRHYLSVCKLILAYHLDCDEAIDDFIAEAEEYLYGGPGLISVAQFYFYQALGMLKRLESGSLTDKSDTIELIGKNLRWMSIWSKASPSTFQHKHDLIKAERARVLGDTNTALSLYELAISGARASGFTHEEALTNELYARFWDERGNNRFAVPLIREACSLYRQWGALAKAEYLAQSYSKWIQHERALVYETSESSNQAEARLAELDQQTILKASLEIAAELDIESLLVKLLNIAMENAGAQYSCLLQKLEGKWVVAAQSSIDKIGLVVVQSQNLENSDTVSESVVNYVANTKIPLVLKDAAREAGFLNDPTIQKRQIKSILCVPLIYRDRIKGILYLENNSASGAFSFEQVELVKLLSSQIALSLDNAHLYANLANSEERFRATFEQAAVGIAHVAAMEPVGRFLRINKKFCDLVGYTREEMFNLTFQDITHPDDLNTDLEQVQKLLEGEISTYSLEKRYFRKDCTTIWVNLTVSFLRDREGNPDYFVSVVSDISDRKQAEKDLIDSRDFLAHLASAVPDAIYSIKMPERSIEWANDSFGVMGYDDEEYIGHSTQEYYASSEEFHRVGLLQQEAIRKGEDYLRTEITVVHKDGRVFPAELTATYFREGGQISRITAMVRDISDRKKAEAKLIESEKRYRSLVDNSMVGVFHSTVDGRYIFVNQAMAEMFDFDSPDQLISMGPVSLYKDKKERDRFLATLLEHESVTNYETEAVSHANRHMHVMFSARLIGNDIFGMIMDITERKEAEQKIFESRQRLKSLASQLTIVEEKERRIIAAGLHDQVGQSLALARIQLASASNITADPKLVSQLSDISANLHEAINNTQTLMLELSSPTIHDMGLSSAVSEWLENHVEKKYSLECKVIDNVAKGLGKSLDPDARAILFRNVRELVVNVIKHSQATMVNIIFEDRSPNLRIIVADNGIGFSPNTTRHSGSETGGFGLFSIEELMTDLGGSLKIVSDLGTGCTAILSAPLSAYHEQERA